MPHAPIRILSEDTARRIAAGEVIDRPAAVLRELLDNALDAGASSVDCYVEEGGNGRIRLVDDGEGIAAADLELCGLPHATSKLRALEDLDRLATLGFRGEALASIAACSKLEISSAQGNAGSGQRLVIEGGKRLVFEPQPPRPGTIVDVSRLFFNMPARKRFLKRPQTEGSLCKAVFIDKALAFPNIAFRFWNDDELALFLPPATLRDRVAAAYQKSFAVDFLEEISSKGEGFAYTAVCSRPDVARNDRKYLQIFVNRRRIFEFSLLQAVEYAYAGFLPGGLRPVAFVYLDIDPSLIDFNIHPAKREARFRTLPLLHGALVALVKGWLEKSVPAAFRVEAPHATGAPAFGAGDGGSAGPSLFGPIVHETDGMNIIEAFHRVKNELRPSRTTPAGTLASVPGPRYLGQLWRTYLAAALGGELILVDQHAAHERLLFDELSKKPHSVQPLAVPLAFSLEEEELNALLAHEEALAQLGFTIVATGHSCEVRALPALLSGAPEAEVIAFLKNARGPVADLERQALAQAACRAAVKAGDELDPISAQELINRALALPDPRCPHGRPVIQRLSHAAIDKLFQRVV
jgi:DNA mismatch repair protein MutL